MRSALVLGLLICCSLLHWSDSQELTARGPRVMQPSDRSRSTKEGCSDGSDLPVCSDDDWGPKCPSGCRIEGLMDLEDRKTDDRVRKIQQMLDDYSKMYGSTHVTVTQAVRKIRETLNEVGDSGTTYYQLVNSLKTRLVSLQERINYQTNKIRRLKDVIFQQFEEITRLEVDIDIKIRSCKGSCAKSFTYTINRESGAQLDKNLRSLSSMSIGRVEYSKPTHVFKMRRIKDSDPASLYKSGTSNSRYPEFWAEKEFQIFSLEVAPEGGSGVYTANVPSTSTRDGTSTSDGSFSLTGNRRDYGETPTIAPATRLDSSRVHAETPEPFSDGRYFETFDRRQTSATGHGDGGREESRVVYYPGSNSDDIGLHTTHGSSTYTKTTVTKDGKTSERVTMTSGSPDIPDFLDSQFDRFRLQIGGESGVSGLGSRKFTTVTETKTIKGGSPPELSPLTATGIKTGKHSIVTEGHTVTHTGDSDPFADFSNSEVFRDFQTFDPSQPLTEHSTNVRDRGSSVIENSKTHSVTWTTKGIDPAAHESIQRMLKSIIRPLAVDETGEDNPDRRDHI